MKIDKSIIPQDVLDICVDLTVHGHRSWIVGGCTRDMILGKTPHDWDIATDATPDRVQEIFHYVIPTGIQHGTVTVMLKGVGYEVTTLRGEGEYSDGRRPDEVRFVSDIHKDLARRDFTMNAIAFDPIMDVIVDPFGGQDDIRNRKIKAVGDPIERFSEDGLRVLRGARFCSTLDFTLDDETERAINPTIETFRKVSAERVREELVKTMRANNPSYALNVMIRTGLFKEVFGDTSGVDIDGALFILDTAKGDVPRRLATLMVFIFENDVSRAAAWLDSMKFSNEERNRVLVILNNFQKLFEGMFVNEGEARRFIKAVGRDHVDDVLWITEHLVEWHDDQDDVRTNVELVRTVSPRAVLSTRELAISGNDLTVELGMKPGPEMGKTLNRLLELVLDNPLLNTRENLLTLCKGEKQHDRT